MRLVVALVSALALAIAAGADASAPVWKAWLCRPDLKVNYCNTVLSVTAIDRNGSRTVESIPDTRNPPVDCFYVYPTVSTERRGNADLKIHPNEEVTAVTQAARFAQVCRVFAPIYRQVTAMAGSSPSIPEGDRDLAYADVLAAWRDYLAHWNAGRGVVLVGHSQGAHVLERLLLSEYGSVKKHLVSALLLGGNVVVDANDRDNGVPACRSTTQTGCIVAYSSWGQTPPDNGSLASSGHVLCVNPAAPAGGGAPITPIFPWFAPEGIMAAPLSPRPKTLWLSFPDLYTARCVQQGQRSWLLVTRIRHPGDPRPTVAPVLSPGLGLHAADVNIALGELIGLVRSQAKTYTASH